MAYPIAVVKTVAHTPPKVWAAILHMIFFFANVRYWYDVVVVPRTHRLPRLERIGGPTGFRSLGTPESAFPPGDPPREFTLTLLEGEVAVLGADADEEWNSIPLGSDHAGTVGTMGLGPARTRAIIGG